MVRDIPTSVLLGVRLQPPFTATVVPIVTSVHVASNVGSGCVHIAGAFGPEDYQLVTQTGRQPKLIMDKDGRYNTQAE